MMSFFKQIKICFVFLLINFGQTFADDYYLGGMFTQHYRDGVYAEWGKYSRLGAKIAIKHINDEDRLDGDKILMPDENIIDYHCWNENVVPSGMNTIRLPRFFEKLVAPMEPRILLFESTILRLF